MEFLCPNHRRQFAELASQERKELWLFWMENAYNFGQQGQWRDVIALSGSAFDLACLQDSRDESPMHIELTLSAILVCDALSDLGNTAATEEVMLQALEALLDMDDEASPGKSPELAECVSVIMDNSRQAEFFSDYLNWPRFHAGRHQQASFSTRLH